MSHSFCPLCQNLLFINTQSDELKFVCRACHTSIVGSETDTLRYEEIEGEDITIYNKMLKKIADDPVSHKVRKPCPKCAHDIARDVTLGNDMRTIYICTKCKHQWV